MAKTDYRLRIEMIDGLASKVRLTVDGKPYISGNDKLAESIRDRTLRIAQGISRAGDKTRVVIKTTARCY